MRPMSRLTVENLKACGISKTDIAHKCKVTSASVTKWKVRGIPKQHHSVILKMLEYRLKMHTALIKRVKGKK